jgi:hypothetical protein
MRVRFALGAVCAALHLKERVMNIIKEVRAAWVAREIKRLMPVSNKTEPVEQRHNPARAARKAAKKEQA